MKRLLGFALLLMAVNLVCQAGLVLVTRRIDLSFGAFAGLVLIPLFQSSILVLASPEPGRIGLVTQMRTLRQDRVTLLVALGVLIAAGALAPVEAQAVWSVVFVGLLAVSACMAIACHASMRVMWSAPMAMAGAAAVFFSLEIAFGFLRGIAGGFRQYPTVLVLIATYTPLFIATIVVLLAMERVMRSRCASAGRMVELAIFLVVAGSLVVAGNYFHYPMVREPWLRVVRQTALLAIGGVLVAETLFLRHHAGCHVETA